MVIEDDTVALTLNKYPLYIHYKYSSIFTSLNIPKVKDSNPLSERISQPTLGATIKYTI